VCWSPVLLGKRLNRAELACEELGLRSWIGQAACVPSALRKQRNGSGGGVRCVAAAFEGRSYFRSVLPESRCRASGSGRSPSRATGTVASPMKRAIREQAKRPIFTKSDSA
jgi:hypothetical protein